MSPNANNKIKIQITISLFPSFSAIGCQPSNPIIPSNYNSQNHTSMSTEGKKSDSSSGEAPETWGTKLMGPPAAPSSHPQNQRAATWVAPAAEQNPYLEYSPASAPKSPMETILDTFNEWGRKTETMAQNMWQNLKTGPSVAEAAWGKLSLGAKAVREGGFEALYKQTFAAEANEKLNKTFACYLSTSTGPVAGTLYLSNLHVAFCSDRLLCFTAPSGQQAWSYYKVGFFIYLFLFCCFTSYHLCLLI